MGVVEQVPPGGRGGYHQREPDRGKEEDSKWRTMEARTKMALFLLNALPLVSVCIVQCIYGP